MFLVRTIVAATVLVATTGGCQKLQGESQTVATGNMSPSTGTFVPIDARSVAIVGLISSESVQQFLQLLSGPKEIKTVHLRSGGGDVVATMEIGREIRRRGIDIVVDGYCYSSCANYLFIAGRKKSVVGGGMLLLHGGSSFTPETVFDAFPRTTSQVMAIRTIAQLNFARMSGNAAHLRAYDAFLNATQSARASNKNEELESEYFREMGVKPDLLHYSEVVCMCGGKSDFEFRVQVSHSKARSVPQVSISTNLKGIGSKSVWLVPPREDWEAVGVRDIIEFWSPNAATRAIEAIRNSNRTRYETRSVRSLTEEDCLAK